jgi:hypothetical protein
LYRQTAQILHVSQKGKLGWAIYFPLEDAKADEGKAEHDEVA